MRGIRYSRRIVNVKKGIYQPNESRSCIQLNLGNAFNQTPSPWRTSIRYFASTGARTSKISNLQTVLQAFIFTSIGAFASIIYVNWGDSQAPPKDTISNASTAPLSAGAAPIYDLSAANLSGARDEFLALLGPSGISEDPGTLVAHSSTAWSPAPRGELDRPSVVVYPRCTADVSAIAAICHRRRIPMIGFSGGTSLEGTLAALHHEVCLDFARMDRVLAVHERDLDAVVQPGVGYLALNELLAARGLFFPPDPGPGAMIGGMVSQGCSGTNAFRHGTMRDWVLGLTVVLADGTVVRTRQRPRKSNAGYDLTRLMVGSEGTLGFITEASLRLTSKPLNERVAVASFPSTYKAVDTAIKIVQSGHPVAALELLDTVSMKAVNQSGYCSKEWPETATLFLKFSGSPASVEEQIKAVRGFAHSDGCVEFAFSKDKAEADELWLARKTALWCMLAMKENPEDKFLSADAAVPISRLAEIIEITQEKLQKSGLIGSCIGHVGDGNFHASVLYGAKDKEIAEKIIQETQELGVQMGGTVTGEHGIGLAFRDMLTYELGDEAVDMMRKIKLALDPLCLLNPEKVFRLKIDPDR